MRAAGVVLLLILGGFIGIQILLRNLLGEETESLTTKARRQEQVLDQELQLLHNASLLLNDIQLQLREIEASQKRSGHLIDQLSTAEVVEQAKEVQLRQEDALQKKAEAADARGAKTVSLAGLAEALEKEKQAAAELSSIGLGTTEYPTHDQEGQQLIFPPGNEDGACVAGVQESSRDALAAVVSLTFDRPEYLRRHLDSLLAVHGGDSSNRRKFPLHISQDGKVPKHTVANVAKASTAQGVRYLHHRETTEPKRLLNKKESLAYYRIANHYKFIMRTIFDCFGYSKLILLEDDMELAPDFFSYFEATSGMLSSDPSLFCISSWNDHGQSQFVRDETRLSRSDFFPGLGWMLTKDVWLEVRDSWPKAYWDDWMRLNKVRRGRQCIRPEVCRTYNFGAKGSSHGMYYKRFLAPIRLNTVDVDWSKADLAYLQLPRFDTELNATLAAAKVVGTVDEAKDMTGDVLLKYDSQKHYETLTGRLGMLREWKDGIPRGAYKGVVSVHWEGVRVFFAPSEKFSQLTEDSGAAVRVDATGAIVWKKALPRKVGTMV